MQRYKKRAMEVEAVQLTEELLDSVQHPDHVPGVLYDPVNRMARMTTPWGPMVCLVGSWIIRDGKGGIYPMKPNTFEQLYEPADVPPLFRLAIATGETEKIEEPQPPGPTGCGSG